MKNIFFTQVTVEIEDINDNQPQFDSFSYKTFVVENKLPDEPIVQVRCSDKDSKKYSTIKYR